MSKCFVQGTANNVRFTLSVGDTNIVGSSQLVLSETNRIGDTKYNS